MKGAIETIVFLLSMLERVTTYGTMLAMDFAKRFAKARIVMIQNASTDMRKVIRLVLEKSQGNDGLLLSSRRALMLHINADTMAYSRSRCLIQRAVKVASTDQPKDVSGNLQIN